LARVMPFTSLRAQSMSAFMMSTNVPIVE
jgi:hypothetical protein